MTRRWFQRIVIILCLLATQSVFAQDVTLIPFSSDQGFTGLVPEGWTEAAPGVFARGESASDSTVLIQQAAPGMRAEDLAGLLARQLGLGTLPERSGLQETGVMEWTLYAIPEFDVQGTALAAQIGLAEDSEQSYVVVLLTTPDEYPRLVETVFFPVLDAYTPITAEATPAPDVMDVVEPAEQPEAIYTDPDGLFTVPIPTNWTASQEDGYGLLTDPEGLIKAYVLSVEGEDIPQAVDDTFRSLYPEFEKALEDADIQTPPASAGLDEVAIVTYDFTQDEGVVFQGIGQRVGDRIYLMLFDADIAAATRRSSQINVIATGFTITELEETNLSGTAARPVDDVVIAELESFINDAMAQMNIPGAAVAIVQNGEVVYSQGFGVTELGGDVPVTADTQMMIGSTTKTFTTLYLATLVDEGVIDWDTPVVEIAPSFKLADPEITEQITVQNLVCACSGVPRRDVELILNIDELTPEDIVASLAEFQFFTDFGEAFQYSNQLVAMGGFAGAFAEGAGPDNINDVYMDAIQARILDPVGMESTTFSFEDVEAGGNYAMPHGSTLLNEYVTIPLDYERFVLPIAPAGALWSTAEDMSQYMLMQLANGETADGTRIVSEENLNETRQPQVEITAQMSYGLGWFVGEYKGLQLIDHGGNTFGFTSDFAFLPEADLGIVVITNASGSNLFNQSARTRLFELVFDQEAESVRDFEFAMTQTAEALAEASYSEVDAEAVEPFLGTFENAALGSVTLALEDGRLIADVGEFQTELRGAMDEESGEIENYVTFDPPLAGIPVELVMEDGEPVIVIDLVTDVYRFERE